MLDTLQANRERCVGMAANMIGIKKRIIVVSAGEADLAMLNPVIIKNLCRMTRKRDAFPWRETERPDGMKL